MWLSDVAKAANVIRRGGFKGITHGGVAHADDTIAAALLHRAGAEAIYRLNEAEEALAVEGDVVLFDIGDSFAAGLPQRFVVLDHHGVGDPAEEPSSVVQVVLAVGARASPLVQTLINFVDLFDRFGPSVKRWAGPYGNSLNNGLAKYFGDATPKGLVKEEKFLSLVADAFYSTLDIDLAAFGEAFRVAEKLKVVDLAERFPRTFHLLRLMLQAARDPLSASTSKEALEAGFGIDFGSYALLAVPELEPYIVRGLESHFSEARRAAEAAERGRYTVVKGPVTAVAVEDHVPPGPLYNALLDLGVLNGPAFIVVKDRRNPGAYTLWRPDKFAREIDFRRLEGDRVVFKHASGFLAVVKAESAEEAAKYAMALWTSSTT